MTRAAQGRGPITDKVAQNVIGYFQRAVHADPTHLVAGLNHVEALIVIRHTKQAAGFARQMLNLQDKAMLTREALDAPHFPPEVDDFWIEWDRTAWANAGDPAAEARAKHGLIRWRLLLILADLGEDLQPFYEAVLARPDMPVSQAALGCALARKGKLAESVELLAEVYDDLRRMARRGWRFLDH